MAARVDLKDASLGVMRKAKELREHFQAKRSSPEQQHGLCTPDAIHLATAVIFDCVEFHTFDKNHKRGCSGLLKLGPLPAGVKLKICTPKAPSPQSQGNLLEF